MAMLMVHKNMYKSVNKVLILTNQPFMSCVVIFIADMSRMSRSLTKLLTKGILNLFSMTLPSPLSMSTGTMHLNHSKHK